MNEHASITQATTFIAGNGVMLYKVFDHVSQQPLPLPHPWVTLVALILPPIVGLYSALLILHRIEGGNYRQRRGVDILLPVLSQVGFGMPLLVWIEALLGVPVPLK